ncbi:GNAT family N-acetyltransferase [Aquimonas voraii]|uniref:Ribosomal protein S18 acetylase RimI n=1 Tax=Aquimonas voraii TaxID=265719 RepID=A0A1G6ZYH3_9GAMM|nr:GNAT family N-acetyltransferase [Aquimonas voraii]SDE06885.1 Ribosomal protein S18 acetylase RimI [Aquimonas voraii]
MSMPVCAEPTARTAALRQLFAGDWRERPAALTLREETGHDLALLRSLYASTRSEELARSGWTDIQQQAFIDQQFNAQRSHYRQHYPGAVFFVIEHAGAGIGRLYLHWGREELRLMEITLLPDWRGRGVARQLMRQMLDWSAERSLPITLHVEPFNPAHAWYLRLGFDTLEVRGVYHFMRRAPQG